MMVERSTILWKTILRTNVSQHGIAICLRNNIPRVSASLLFIQIAVHRYYSRSSKNTKLRFTTIITIDNSFADLTWSPGIIENEYVQVLFLRFMMTDRTKYISYISTGYSIYLQLL